VYLLYYRWGVIFAYRSVLIKRKGLKNLLPPPSRSLLIKDLEGGGNKNNTIHLNSIHNTVLQSIRDYILKNNNYLNPFERRLKSLIWSTTKFYNSHLNVIFIRADKGNITVVLNTKVYLNKIEDILSDTSSYIKIKKNPINTIKKTLNKTLKT